MNTRYSAAGSALIEPDPTKSNNKCTCYNCVRKIIPLRGTKRVTACKCDARNAKDFFINTLLRRLDEPSFPGPGGIVLAHFVRSQKGQSRYYENPVHP